MVKIRLRRVGRIHNPIYRVVVADSRSPRDGSFLAVIGRYNPQTNPATVQIDREQALLWLSRGAKPTDTVSSLLTRAGISPTSARPNGAE